MVTFKNYDDLEQYLENLTTPDSVFPVSYRELAGVIFFSKKGDLEVTDKLEMHWWWEDKDTLCVVVYPCGLGD